MLRRDRKKSKKSNENILNNLSLNNVYVSSHSHTKIYIYIFPKIQKNIYILSFTHSCIQLPLSHTRIYTLSLSAHCHSHSHSHSHSNSLALSLSLTKIRGWCSITTWGSVGKWGSVWKWGTRGGRCKYLIT